MKTFFTLSHSHQLIKKVVLSTILFVCFEKATANYTIASGTSVNASTITAQSGLLTVNGTLYVDQSVVSLLNFTSVIVNAPDGKIYWNGNYDLKFASNITFDIAPNAPGLQPTTGNGNASTRLYVGTTVIAVSSDNSQNAAFSFAEFNAAGGLPQFTLSASVPSPSCYASSFTTTLTPIDNIVSFDCKWAVSNGTISPAVKQLNFQGSQTATITSTASLSYIVSCTVYKAGDNDAITTISRTITFTSLPTVFTLTGGGAYCTSGAGLPVSLSNSQTGVKYQLLNNGSKSGSVVAGVSGSAINFGLQTAAGTYTVVAANATTGCTSTMTGTAVVTINPLPTTFSVTGGGSYCSGGPGVAVGLTGSESGVNYQLYNGPSAVGAAVAGTGSALNFGLQTAAGTYTVIATNATTCTNTMTGSASITITAVTPGAATWTGAANDGNWSNPVNWACSNMPSSSVNAIIPSAASSMPSTISLGNAFALDVDVQAGASLTIPVNTTLNLYGKFVNPAASYAIAGTVNFASGNQSIPALTYGGIEVNGTGLINKTLAGPVAVTKKLVLGNGIVITSASSMLMIKAGAVLTAGNSNSYIQGPMARETNSGLAYEFPIGYGSLRSVYITPTANPLKTDTFSVTYHNSPPVIDVLPSISLGGVEVNEYWDVNGTASSPTVIDLYYQNPGNAASWSGNAQPCLTCNVAVVQGTLSPVTNLRSWDFAGSSASGFTPAQTTFFQTNNKVSSRTVSSFGQFSFGFAYNVILPVKLEKFTGSIQGSNAKLDWKFADTKDLVSGTVQYSTDGVHFKTISTTKPDPAILSYNYTHQNIANGANYYRLAFKDKQGKEYLSKTVLLVPGADKTIIKGIRPTIADGVAFVDIHAAGSQPVQLSVYDMNGRTVANISGSLQQGENSFRLNFSGYSTGWYNVMARTADGVIANLRIMKK